MNIQKSSNGFSRDRTLSHEKISNQNGQVVQNVIKFATSQSSPRSPASSRSPSKFVVAKNSKMWRSTQNFITRPIFELRKWFWPFWKWHVKLSTMGPILRCANEKNWPGNEKKRPGNEKKKTGKLMQKRPANEKKRPGKLCKRKQTQSISAMNSQSSMQIGYKLTGKLYEQWRGNIFN